MSDAEFHEFVAKLQEQFFILKKRTIFYFLGGAAISIGGFFTWVGLSLEEIRSGVASRFETEVISEIAELSEVAMARAEEIEALALSSRETANALGDIGQLLMWTYDNNEESIESSFAGARMVVIARQREDGRAHSVPVNHPKLEQLCGDIDGCTIRLGGAPFTSDTGLLAPVTGLQVPRSGGACGFFYNTENGHWTLDNPCTYWRQGLQKSDDGFVDAGEWKPYSPSNAWGVDGSASLGDDTIDGSALPLLSYLFACYLFEAPADSTSNRQDATVLADTDRGFHLIFAGANWKDFPISRFSPRDQDRYCLLIVDD